MHRALSKIREKALCSDFGPGLESEVSHHRTGRKRGGHPPFVPASQPHEDSPAFLEREVVYILPWDSTQGRAKGLGG